MEFLKDLITNIGIWLEGLLASTGLTETWVRAIMLVIGAFVLACIPMVAAIFLVWFERKIAARLASRFGPDDSGAYDDPPDLRRVFGDTIKTLTKEDAIPAGEGEGGWIFSIASVLVLATAVLAWAVIPLGQGLIGADLNIGILYTLSLGSGSMIGMLMTGWGSGDRCATPGGIRSIVTWTSAEIPLVLSVLVVAMVAGSFSLPDIIVAQDIPFLFTLPVTALLFFVASLAGVGQWPSDSVETGSEVMAWRFNEHSGVKSGMFYLAQSTNRLAVAAIFSTLFLGGWRGPWVDQVPILGTVWLVLKVLLFTLTIQFLRHTLPRLRIDRFNWKLLTPLALVNVCAVALVGKAVPMSASPWARAGAFLGVNVLLALVLLALTRQPARQPAANG